jgi:hypothetical protein
MPHGMRILSKLQQPNGIHRFQTGRRKAASISQELLELCWQIAAKSDSFGASRAWN